MYLNIVSLPTFSPAWAHQVLTELVRAVVIGMSPNCSPPEFESGTPSIGIGERPLSTELVVKSPLSRAAVAVTTFIVEPGGQPAWVARLKSGALSSVLKRWKVRLFSTWLGSYSGRLTI